MGISSLAFPPQQTEVHQTLPNYPHAKLPLQMLRRPLLRMSDVPFFRCLASFSFKAGLNPATGGNRIGARMCVNSDFAVAQRLKSL